MNLRTITSAPARVFRRSGIGPQRPPVKSRRPALYLAVAAAGAVMVNVLTAGSPTADAAQVDSVSVAHQLGIAPGSTPWVAGNDIANDIAPLEQLAASRSQRDAAATAAAQVQAAADQAERDRIAAEQAAAAQAAAEQAAAEQAAAEEAAAQQSAVQEAAAVAPSGSYQDYALSKLGGSGSEFTCLENLWGKESGWDPNAQNPSSTAYGIPQFLDSTWAGTGIAKTSDGYRQIDAGLIYIDERYGSACGAWAHSQANNWY
ncbi:MAG TPA: lytic transglycosylase domain-containing protein [Blastococcus sp.]